MVDKFLKDINYQRSLKKQIKWVAYMYYIKEIEFVIQLFFIFVIWVCFQGKIFNITVIQVNAPT